METTAAVFTIIGVGVATLATLVGLLIRVTHSWFTVTSRLEALVSMFADHVAESDRSRDMIVGRILAMINALDDRIATLEGYQDRSVISADLE